MEIDARSCFTPNDPDIISDTDSRSINRAIEKASACGCGIVTIPRYNARVGSFEWTVDESVLLPDDITVVLDGCRITQAEGCYCNMFRNSNSFTEVGKTLAGEQKNIRIVGRSGALLDGGVYNGHSEWNTKDGSLINNTMLLFTNVSGFSVENVNIRHQRWWGMTFAFCRGGALRNIGFEADFAKVGPDGSRIPADLSCYQDNPRYEDIYVKNGDGIDLRAGCSDIIIENITGQTEDDTVALTALKGDIETRFFVPGKDWEIKNITIRNIASSVLSGGQLRLLCADGCKVHDVSSDAIVDTNPYRGWQTSVFLGYAILDEYINEKLPQRGDLSNISISNLFSNSTRAILLGCAVDNVRITNIFCKKDVLHAIQSVNAASISNTLVDGVFCSDGSCPDSVFDFCAETSGQLDITNVRRPTVRNAGSLRVREF